MVVGGGRRRGSVHSKMLSYRGGGSCVLNFKVFKSQQWIIITIIMIVIIIITILVIVSMISSIVFQNIDSLWLEKTTT